MKHRRCIYWEDEEWKRIKQFAKRKGISASDVVRMAVVKYLEEGEKR